MSSCRRVFPLLLVTPTLSICSLCRRNLSWQSSELLCYWFWPHFSVSCFSCFTFYFFLLCWWDDWEFVKATVRASFLHTTLTRRRKILYTVCSYWPRLVLATCSPPCFPRWRKVSWSSAMRAWPGCKRVNFVQSRYICRVLDPVMLLPYFLFPESHRVLSLQIGFSNGSWAPALSHMVRETGGTRVLTGKGARELCRVSLTWSHTHTHALCKTIYP